jgi:hypothetical protein
MELQVRVALALVEGAPSVPVELALFEEMLVGWRSQQFSRRLGGSLIEGRERTVRRFQVFADGWPWDWRADSGRWASEHYPADVPPCSNSPPRSPLQSSPNSSTSPPGTATRWTRDAGGDWSRYAADLARERSHQT